MFSLQKNSAFNEFYKRKQTKMESFHFYKGLNTMISMGHLLSIRELVLLSCLMDEHPTEIGYKECLNNVKENYQQAICLAVAFSLTHHGELSFGKDGGKT